MNTVKFYDIPTHTAKYRTCEKVLLGGKWKQEWELIFDGDKNDHRLFLSESIAWTNKSEKKYKQVERILNKKAIRRKRFVIGATYDVSGWNYWVNFMREDNYIQICIWFTSEDIPTSSIPSIMTSVGNLYEYYLSIINSKY